jgi:hypothetical protein
MARYYYTYRHFTGTSLPQLASDIEQWVNVELCEDAEYVEHFTTRLGYRTWVSYVWFKCKCCVPDYV